MNPSLATNESMEFEVMKSSNLHPDNPIGDLDNMTSNM